VPFQGVRQPGQFRQGIGDLATGAGANPKAVIDVDQCAPADPFGLDGKMLLLARRGSPVTASIGWRSGAAGSRVSSTRGGSDKWR
jgi:hypothetical protein